jgi:hypothetical protein
LFHALWFFELARVLVRFDRVAKHHRKRESQRGFVVAAILKQGRDVKRSLLRTCWLGMIFAVVLVGAIVADDNGIAVTRHEERVAGAISNAHPNARQAPVGATEHRGRA